MDNICIQKIRLLCEGASVQKGIHKGRKSGAGPAGGTFFELGDSIINLPLWPKFAKSSKFRLRKKGDYWQIIHNGEVYCNLTKIPQPKFYSMKTSDGTSMKKIALVHGKDCLATTIYQKCVYWRKGLQCKFCGIEFSFRESDTILKKSPQQILEVLLKGIEEKRVKHVTLTTGTLENREKEVKMYSEIVKKIKNNVDIPIHVQLEPTEQKNLEKLASLGVDTIGIHIENFEEKIRHSVCPGKYKSATLNDYKKSWKDAVEIFGDAQVSSYIIIGIGESTESVIKGSEWLIRNGVVPFIIPIKPIIGTVFEDYSAPSYVRTLKICQAVGDKLREYGLDPFKNKAGCVRCGACSPIKEALKYLT
ncbi:MAG: MSMEG_0568 family radical SAM protein [Candidatus Helarchaeota archaeon]